MIIATQVSTGLLLEMQSDATPGTLIANAVLAGYDEKDVVESEVTPEQYAALLPAIPDPGGFLVELKSAVGGVVQANQLSRAYPLFQTAVQQRMFTDVSALVVDAKNTQVLSQQQYDTIKQLATKYRLPLVLP